MVARARTVGGLYAAVFAGTVQAWQVETSQVGRSDGLYRVRFDVALAVPAESVRRLISDYPGLTRLSPTVLESEVLASEPDGSLRLRLVQRGCVWFFCKTLRRVVTVRTLPDGSVEAVTPGTVDLHQAVERWQVVEAGQEAHSPHVSRLIYRAELRPAFYVPPLIGPWLMQRVLRKELVIAARNIERYAVVP